MAIFLTKNPTLFLLFQHSLLSWGQHSPTRYLFLVLFRDRDTVQSISFPQARFGSFSPRYSKKKNKLENVQPFPSIPNVSCCITLLENSRSPHAELRNHFSGHISFGGKVSSYSEAHSFLTTMAFVHHIIQDFLVLKVNYLQTCTESNSGQSGNPPNQVKCSFISEGTFAK